MFVVAGLEARADRVDARRRPALVSQAVEEARRGRRARHPRRAAVRRARPQGRGGLEAWDDEGIVQLATRAIKDAAARAAGDRRTCACASTPTTATAACCATTARSTTTRRSSCSPAPRSARRAPGADVVAPSDMMDGRVGAIRAALDDEGLDRHADHGLQREVRLGLLRPVPRRGRLRARRSATGAATRWTPPTRARRCARRARRRGGRRHGHGQAGAALPRRAARASRRRCRCRSPPTTSAASTR